MGDQGLQEWGLPGASLAWQGEALSRERVAETRIQGRILVDGLEHEAQVWSGIPLLAAAPSG